MYNTALNVADFGFETLERIERFDYSALGEKVIKFSATVAAVVVAVVTYVVTALQLFWLEHGEAITVNAIRFTVATADFAGACFFAGRKLRPVVNHWVARLADSAFYGLAA